MEVEIYAKYAYTLKLKITGYNGILTFLFNKSLSWYKEKSMH